MFTHGQRGGHTAREGVQGAWCRAEQGVQGASRGAGRIEGLDERLQQTEWQRLLSGQ